MSKFNLSQIMRRAWRLFRNGCKDFAQALHASWLSAKVNRSAVELAKQAAGVNEEVHTWYGWKAAGYTVAHGSKALFQALEDAPEKGAGKTAVKSFFGKSQVTAL